MEWSGAERSGAVRCGAVRCGAVRGAWCVGRGAWGVVGRGAWGVVRCAGARRGSRLSQIR